MDRRAEPHGLLVQAPAWYLRAFDLDREAPRMFRRDRIERPALLDAAFQPRPLMVFADALRADEVLQRELRSLPNVEVHVNAETTRVTGQGRVDGLVYRDRRSGEQHRVDVAGVFVQIGLLPNTDLLRGAVALSERGEIEVDARGQTSVPGIFAAGDATTTPFKQIVVALGEGAKASLAAFEHLIRTGVAAAA